MAHARVTFYVVGLGVGVVATLFARWWFSREKLQSLSAGGQNTLAKSAVYNVPDASSASSSTQAAPAMGPTAAQNAFYGNATPANWTKLGKPEIDPDAGELTPE